MDVRITNWRWEGVAVMNIVMSAPPVNSAPTAFLTHDNIM